MRGTGCNIIIIIPSLALRDYLLHQPLSVSPVQVISILPSLVSDGGLQLSLSWRPSVWLGQHSICFIFFISQLSGLCLAIYTKFVDGFAVS
ncbi:unnamed protein product [Protopolystoma xenopodis]|uniref:Uncharacterized protein n=1 Tax=Protopolystoma xenopodis TaxID=117903 RepID=A0A448X1F6_9PLAT|nr:unnamed protein product [Protopolystoma xenopodis]